MVLRLAGAPLFGLAFRGGGQQGLDREAVLGFPAVEHAPARARLLASLPQAPGGTLVTFTHLGSNPLGLHLLGSPTVGLDFLVMKEVFRC